ncbi:MAG: prepilin-type N-terminal cleavage/methylation domain-containing protein [Verrucomicrobiota bacterium]|nr:prepilin-type N-terminal cleavage/methylation domain-containing protein [Verrucomicrobiota bacterium]
MSIGRAKNRRRGAFTLLEIMLAVGILAMMALAIYRFVQTNLVALRISSEASAVNAQYSGFVNLITSEWQRLPAGKAAMLGEALKLSDRSRDEISWTTTAGPGLLTRYASGEYLVTLKLRPVPQGKDRMEIGVARQSKSDTGAEGDVSWVTLLPDVESLQIHYFDPRLNTWLDKWTDTITLPRLVKLTIGRPNESLPWEAIIALGRTPL